MANQEATMRDEYKLNKEKAAYQRRVENFSYKDKELLCEIVKHFPILDSKKYDSETIHKKKLAWENVATIFNASSLKLPERDEKSLRGLWRRTKALRKSVISNGHLSESNRTDVEPLSPASGDEQNDTQFSSDEVRPMENIYGDDHYSAETQQDTNEECSADVRITESVDDLEIHEDFDFEEAHHVQHSPIKRRLLKNNAIMQLRGGFVRRTEELHAIHVREARLKEQRADAELKKAQLELWRTEQSCLKDGLGLPPQYHPVFSSNKS